MIGFALGYGMVLHSWHADSTRRSLIVEAARGQSANGARDNRSFLSPVPFCFFAFLPLLSFLFFP